jgi:hypothetical protein
MVGDVKSPFLLVDKMSNVDDVRIEMSEHETSFKADDLAEAMQEIDTRFMDANNWSTITYSTGLISKIEFFSDALKTNKTMKREFTRTVGSDGINYITGIVTTTYNEGGTVDSVITTTISRTDNKIDGCSSVFSTSEILC